jgi:uncharacterized protein GlcG (DUF336 family)
LLIRSIRSFDSCCRPIGVPYAISVVDGAGLLVAARRMDGSGASCSY